METESSIHPYWSRRPSTPVSFAHVCPTPLWSFPIQAPVQMSLKCCYYMSWPSHIYLLDHLISTFIYLNWINLLLWLWLITNVYDLFPHLTFLNCLEILVCRFWWWMSVISVSLHNWMIPVISILFLKFQFCFLHNLSFHVFFFANFIFQASAPCNPNPCKNGATCKAGKKKSFTCNCPASFRGELCEIGNVTNLASWSWCL